MSLPNTNPLPSTRREGGPEGVGSEPGIRQVHQPLLSPSSRSTRGIDVRTPGSRSRAKRPRHPARKGRLVARAPALAYRLLIASTSTA